MSSNVRGVILRALFEPDFHNQLVNNPDAALTGYELTAAEVEALKNPSPALYKLLQPGTDVLSSAHGVLLAGDGPPPPPPVTVTVIVVVAITVFVAAVGTGGGAFDSTARYKPLIDAIHQSRGPARMDLVKTLVSELTKGQ